MQSKAYGIKCNDVYLQRCFNHLILLVVIEKVKISEINKIPCGCSKNNTEYWILEKELRDIVISKIFERDMGIKISNLSPSLIAV